METAVIIVSILLIAIVLLQSGKAESASIIQGGSSELFQNRKEVPIIDKDRKMTRKVVSI